MIATTELRLGNICINEASGHLEECEIILIEQDLVEYIGESRIGSCLPENLFPIPLTEEWLKMLGFWTISAGVDDGMRYVAGFELWKCNDLWLCNKNGVVIKSVHQLQNLYFALNEKELTLNKQQPNDKR